MTKNNKMDLLSLDSLDLYYRCDETQQVLALVKLAQVDAKTDLVIKQQAEKLVAEVRKRRLSERGLDAFMLQYDLSSEEGIALMCLAEALLRIPDKETVDKLIKDKLTASNWEQHLGKSHSLFVNAATWALMITGKVLTEPQTNEKQANILSQSLRKLANKGGEPIVRTAVQKAMQILGKQFVKGRTIEEALDRSKEKQKQGYRFSYDMLGEAAYTQKDAEEYFRAYQKAIEALAKNGPYDSPITAPGVSVKLSALHPTYTVKKLDKVLTELTAKLKILAKMAKEANINLTVDAEEAIKLKLSLAIIKEIIIDPQFSEWKGFGLAVQAYQKRALAVIDWLTAIARENKRHLMVRLVKGAYWDSEIKQAQVQGMEGYPVFTRKISTDISFMACVKKLFEAQDVIYPQFATHNAYSLAYVMACAKAIGTDYYEVQCLHGMGDTLYDQIVEDSSPLTCRIYAPVGNHQSLLAYLVRRLLENGANTSFVNRIVNQNLAVSELIENPIDKIKELKEISHPKISLPKNLYGESRQNSSGLDLSEPKVFEPILNYAKKSVIKIDAFPTVVKSDAQLIKHCKAKDVVSPIDSNIALGTAYEADELVLNTTLERAQLAFHRISQDLADKRINALEKLADLLEQNHQEAIRLLILEAGKTLEDAIAEIREAVDFCRYYRLQVIEKFATPQVLFGPTGEHNQISLHGRGVVACISPWNFPLAIFIGQVTAALAAGNTVIAKPAQQTTLIASWIVDLMHEAGFETDVVQLLSGKGSVIGDKLIEDHRIAAIMFTGSTETAQHINLKLAQRRGPIVPFIAETGGQNAMIVDSSALPEQVVSDVIESAFQSAGQRCSALRVLFIQEDIYDKVMTMLIGAMQELIIGNPTRIQSDIGPIIDHASVQKLKDHEHALKSIGKLIARVELSSECEHGSFFEPCAYEIDSLDKLTEEHFGPILHVIKFKNDGLSDVLAQIEKTGYGLTLGIHSRIDETIQYILTRAKVGNIYVNRNMIGAVVGVQPFGGEGLSGTGPKAGGPNYVTRLAVERTLCINTTASGGNASLMAIGD
jgi:RHH-type proline utilization regulon transcriptional repressor/proline dehydrogenase/delta 1-pyrroline-5-carboxylate dehydrogenase